MAKSPKAAKSTKAKAATASRKDLSSKKVVEIRGGVSRPPVAGD